MIFKAAWIAPVAAKPMRRGFVEISGNRIVGVGSLDALPAAKAQGALDLGDVVLTPGLVNPHTHLELTCYGGQLAPAPFWTWIERLVRLRRQPGRVERERSGVRDGAWQSLRAGVTCVGDISRENVSWDLLKTVPIRKVCFVELLSYADQAPRNPDELRVAAAQVVEDPLLTVGITPHMPCSVPEEHIRAAVALAAELDRPWCTHWAETREEVAFLAGDIDAVPGFLLAIVKQCAVQTPALTPIAYLERCTHGGPPGALAHMNYVPAEEMLAVARAGHIAMYCPRAHHFFGHTPHPFRQLQAAGVTVAVGTDSLASNESLSILAELQFLRRHVAEAPVPEVLLRMATLDGARALQLDAQIGSIETGKQADLAAFPVPAGAHDPVAALVDAAPAPTGVWVAGRRVV